MLMINKELSSDTRSEMEEGGRGQGRCGFVRSAGPPLCWRSGSRDPAPNRYEPGIGYNPLGRHTDLSRYRTARCPDLRGGQSGEGGTDFRAGCANVVRRLGRHVSPGRNRGGSESATMMKQGIAHNKSPEAVRHFATDPTHSPLRIPNGLIENRQSTISPLAGLLERKNSFFDERSHYMYESKQNADKMTCQLSDIHVELSRILRTLAAIGVQFGSNYRLLERLWSAPTPDFRRAEH